MNVVVQQLRCDRCHWTRLRFARGCEYTEIWKILSDVHKHCHPIVDVSTVHKVKVKIRNVRTVLHKLLQHLDVILSDLGVHLANMGLFFSWALSSTAGCLTIPLLRRVPSLS